MPVLATTLVTLTLSLLSPDSVAETILQASAPKRLAQSTRTMGTSTDYPPFEYRVLTGDKEEIVGFDIELANTIAKTLGFTTKLENMDFNQLIPALENRQLDFAIAAITPTSERSQRVDFSQVYFESQNAIVTRRQQTLKHLNELSGKRIGVQLGTIQERQIEDLIQKSKNKNVQISRFRRVGEMIQALETGQLDAAIVEAIVAETFVENKPELVFHPIADQPPTQFAIAFPKGSPLVKDFNRVIQQLQASGELELMIRRWFSMQ